MSVLNYKKNYLYISISFFGFSIAVALISLIFSFVEKSPHAIGIEFDIVSLGLGLIILIAILLWTRIRGKFDPFEFPVWISANVYIQIILNVWLLQRDYLPYIPWLRGANTIMMSQAVILYGVGLASLWGGYSIYHLWINKFVKLSLPKVGDLNTWIVIGIWIVGSVINLLSVFIGIISYLGTNASTFAGIINYLRFIEIITGIATAALVINHFQRPKLLGWIWLSILIILNVVTSLVVGSKVFAIFFITLVIYIYYATQKLHKPLLIIGFFSILFLIPVVNNYREILHSWNLGEGVSFSRRINALDLSIRESFGQSLKVIVENTSQTFERRQGNILDITASVMTLHPRNIPFMGPDMLSYTAQQIIPRIVWPDKPIERSEIHYITSIYGGADREYTFTEIGMFADSFRVYGYIFVIIWFFVLGLITSWLYLNGPVKNNLAGIILYIVFLTEIFTYENSITIAVINTIQFTLLLLLIIYFFMYKRYK